MDCGDDAGGLQKGGDTAYGEKDIRVECPTALQGKAPVFGKFPDVGFQGIHQASLKGIMPRGRENG
jgi:hypothetical protein